MASTYDKASLVMIPSGTKAGKIFSQKPVSGDGDFTFTRSSAATRVNADGFIEKETQNLLRQSNSFDTTWITSSASVTSGQSGYDGSSDAWLFNSSGGYIYQSGLGSVSGVHTISVYVKAGTAQGLRIRVDQSSDANYIIDLSDGSLISEGSISYKSTSVGGGWYRMELVFLANTITNIQFRVTDLTGATSSGTAYIQDAQLEQGLVARDYIETTTTAVEGGITDNVPRLDYTDSSCPALLLEPQRTNLLVNSEYFASWNLSGGSLTANATTSPEGVQNAYLYTEDTSTNYHRFNVGAAATNSNKVYSVYAKLADGAVNKWFTIDNGPTAWFDLENGVIGNTQGSVVIDIKPVGNGWYRCIYHNPASTTGGIYIGIAASNGGGGNHTGSGLPAFYAYGAQCEDNVTYATSYIPTYGSSVTRIKDRALTSSSITLATKNFTIFIDSRKMNLSSAGSLDISYKTGGGNVFMYGNCIGWSGASGNEYYCGGTLLGDCKWAFVADYDAGNIKIFLNGSLVKTDTSINLSRFGLGQVELNYLNAMSQYKEVITIPTAISNEEAIDLTTL